MGAGFLRLRKKLKKLKRGIIRIPGVVLMGSE
ncbi:hypothetical protein LCGC14_0659560 [marine sediment metagenome]|uniref:Uncharacterized protein n=1 Tax=marine sediment metagenome TaxID=412755 RepID=A0A0F9QU37_9ZZZZ